MTPGRLSHWREFTPVLSHGSIFVYMMPPQMPCQHKAPQHEFIRIVVLEQDFNLV